MMLVPMAELTPLTAVPPVLTAPATQPCLRPADPRLVLLWFLLQVEEGWMRVGRKKKKWNQARPNGHATLAGGGGDVVVLGLGGGGSEEEEGEPGARPNGHATLAGGGGVAVDDDGGFDDAAAAADAALPPAAVTVAAPLPTCISVGDNDKRAHDRYAKQKHTQCTKDVRTHVGSASSSSAATELAAAAAAEECS